MLNLEKGNSVNLSKAVAEQTNIFGLGWTGKNRKKLDLDTYIAVLDAQRKVLAFVYFGNKNTTGIKHDGDDRSGGGSAKAPNETIRINLSKLHPSATELVAGLFIFQGANSLSDVDYSFAELKDSNNNIVVSYDVKESFGNAKSAEIASLVKKGDEWVFNALGTPSQLGYSGTLSKYTVGQIVSETPSDPGFIRKLFGGIFG